MNLKQTNKQKNKTKWVKHINLFLKSHETFCVLEEKSEGGGKKDREWV